MPKRSLSGQLDAALDAILARRRALEPGGESAESDESARFYGKPGRLPEVEAAAGALPARLGPLAALAQELEGLPRSGFRRNLKVELEGRAIMSGTAKPALEKSRVNPVPEGYHTATPYIAVRGAARAIEFYKQAFGATEVTRLRMPDGSIGHAEIQIGDSRIMLSDEYPEYGAFSPESLGGSPVILHLYTADTDAVLARAAAAGATITAPAADHDYGERSGMLIDPFGHKWSVSTHLETLTFAQYLQRHAAGTLAGMAGYKPSGELASFVRPGFQTAGVYLTVTDSLKAVDFYKRAFGAVENESMRFVDPSGRVAHSEVTIGDSGIMISDESTDYKRFGPAHFGGSPVKIHLYVEDVDALAAQAIAAGARVVRRVEDQFYGERSGRLEDPFGHLWMISSRIEDVSPAEIERRAAEFAKSRAESAAGGAVPGLREGFTAVTPYLAVHRGEELVDFVKTVFGATETFRAQGPAGGTHIEARIGNSMMMLGIAPPHADENPAALHVYVDDVDAAYRKALEMGATSLGEPTDHPYGERGASVVDVSGNYWYVARSSRGSPTPEGLRTVTPYFHPRSGARMIEFLKRAFGAEEIARYQDASGAIVHARMTIYGAAVEMGEAHGPYQPMPMAIYLYVPDVDATYRRALDAGATSVFAPADQPYGDRNAWVRDPEGYTWYIATPGRSATAQV
ncbi:MAG TPA: VOC family protein [Terriglobia bacterium]|nr:VOC family protein [Terriglobia bacterium]